MARQAYDVNSRTKLLDTHKQFNGGLKTVDTDEALKTFYLRNMKNISLSEYGFMEKRYGQYVRDEILINTTGILQGYFQYTRENGTTDEIVFLGGSLYLNGTQVTVIKNVDPDVPDARYPPSQTFSSELGMPDITGGYTAAFQSTREIQGTRVDSKMYFFTGTYPIYYKGNNDFYIMPIYEPNALEIQEFSHNLMEYDYETLYGYNATPSVANNAGVADVGDSTYFGLNEIEYAPNIMFYNLDDDKKNTNEVIKFELSYNWETAWAATHLANASFTEFFLTDASVLNDTGLQHEKFDITKMDYYDATDPYFFSNTLIDEDGGGNYPVGKIVYEEYDGITYYQLAAQTTQGNTLNDGVPNGPYNSLRWTKLETDPAALTGAYRNPLDNRGTEITAEDDYVIDGLGVRELPNAGYRLIELLPAVFYRPAGGTESEWVEVPEDQYINREIRSNAYGLSSTPTYDRIFNDTLDTDPLQKQYVKKYTGNLLDTAPFEVTVKSLPYGTLDIKISLIQRVSGYTKVLGASSSYAKLGFQTVVEEVHAEKLNDIFVSAEKIADYEDYPFTERIALMWDCNKVINHYGKLLVYGSAAQPDRLFVSHPTFVNYFPYFFTQDFKTDSRQAIQNITPFQNVLVVQSATYTWGLSGVDAITGLSTTYNQFTVSPIYGTIAPKSVRPVRNHLYFLSADGIVALKALYANDQTYNVEVIDKNIRNIVPFDDTEACGIQWDDQYWIAFPSTNEVFRYSVDKKAWVRDLYEFERFNGVFSFQRVSGRYLEYISKPFTKINEVNTGIYRIRIDKEIPTDLTEDVSSSFETAFLNQNYPFHPKQYKELKLDFTLQNEYNVSKEPLFEDVIENFDAATFALKYQHTYSISTDVNPGYLQVLYGVEEIVNKTIEEGDTYNATFIWPYPDGTYDLDLSFSGAVTEVSLYDITYSDTVTFKAWAFTEDNALNLDNDNQTTYDATFDTLEEDLGSKFGVWEFGESEFGNKTVTTKTVRLSGKGKNFKLYFEEGGKSKWTLEALGIMFKVKRARGNR